MPVPAFVSTPLGFTLTMRMDTLSASYLRKMELSDRQILAVERIKIEGSITRSVYQSLTGVSEATALRDLRAQVDRGILEQEGTSKMQPQYVLAKEASGKEDVFRVVQRHRG